MPRGFNDYDTARIQGRLWTPEVLRLGGWWDASDLSTMSFSNNKVTEWRDKSGNGLTASQSTDANRPTYSSSAFNQRPSVVFSGSSGVLLSGTGFDPILFPTILFAAQDTGSTSVVAGVFSCGDGGYGVWSDVGTQYIVDGAGVGSASSANTTVSISVPRLISAVYVAANTAGASIYADGALNETNTGDSRSTNSSGSFQIGGRTSGGFPSRVFKGNISEIIIAGNTPPSFQRQAAEGYLSWKWGIPLAANHPFANRPPLIGD